ncbi:MAG: hypothetical protein J0L61_06365, partial [Planctomycetes bacterium]|nr:hypothetical protein [Planctomycetota bacterium]
AQKRAAASAWFPATMQLVRARSGAAAERVEARVRELERTASGLWPVPLVTGDHLIAGGLRPGPVFGVWLERLFDMQLEDRLTTREEGISLVKRWAGGEAMEALEG